jgi:hypothetical protein
MNEYKIFQATDLVNEENLNALAKDGWELITIVSTETLYYFYFKREVVH